MTFCQIVNVTNSNLAGKLSISRLCLHKSLWFILHLKIAIHDGLYFKQKNRKMLAHKLFMVYLVAYFPKVSCSRLQVWVLGVCQWQREDIKSHKTYLENKKITKVLGAINLCFVSNAPCWALDLVAGKYCLHWQELGRNRGMGGICDQYLETWICSSSMKKIMFPI